MTKTKQNNERFMWRTILDHKYDDMKVKRMMAQDIFPLKIEYFKSYISIDERERIDKFAEDLLANLQKSAEIVQQEVAAWKANAEESDNPKKDFAAFLRPKEKIWHNAYWRVWKGENAIEAMMEHALENVDKKFEQVR